MFGITNHGARPGVLGPPAAAIDALLGDIGQSDVARSPALMPATRETNIHSVWQKTKSVRLRVSSLFI